MNPIDLRRIPTYLLRGRRVYKINDPIGESIYQNFLSDEQYITNELNRPIIWKTDEEGFVTLDFQFLIESKEKYLPEQLPNLLSFYGAIYTFYDQDITEDMIIQSDLSQVGKEVCIERIQNGLLKKYRDWFNDGIFGDLEFNPSTNAYRIFILNLF